MRIAINWICIFSIYTKDTLLDLREYYYYYYWYYYYYHLFYSAYSPALPQGLKAGSNI